MKHKRQILVVEDNLLNREMLVNILEDTYTVLQAANGLEALEILYKNKDSISLVMLDVMMPVMDGYAFLDKIKSDAELSLIPVIVMTQSGSEEDEVSALEHGATDFVPKPYRPRVILNRAESLIKLRETSAMINQIQYDSLTGLYSKEFFYQKVREQLMANPEQEYTIICSNIENFKLYNDTFGIKVGDSLLKEIAALAKKHVGVSGFCGRFGADRFLCLLEREHERQERKIFENTEQSFRSHIKNAVMRWGIYEITDRSITVEQMCDRALLAADSIKGHYNQYYSVYNDELRSKMLREKAITDAMETALTEGQFEVYLQPKYSLIGSCMFGAEALVRWIHPEWGFMSPGEFVPLFEKNGFIPKLDKYIWEQVCAMLRDWRKKGYPLPAISVNVSRADIYQLDLAETLLNITKKHGVDPAYLHLEITESAYAENPDKIISTVENLRSLGFIIEMDDFGSGYSSLNMLSRMNLDILKLDMKFVQSETAKPAEQSILNDIVTMAHRISLTVVAEGVETLDQVNRLKSIGCDCVQGYYFAKPMPTDEFEELWREQCLFSAASPLNEQRSEEELRILLVADEDADYRKKLRSNFEGEYRVIEAPDADRAVACIKSCGRDEVSAVILSLTLPKNGAALLLKVMRREPAFWNIPVIAAISGGETMAELSSELETDDFICKRHPIFDLRRRIQLLMEIKALRERESILHDEAGRDHLTDLLNRRGLKAAVDSLRTEDFPLAVCLFDLDDLKKVNDTRGHEAGDKMLRSFAAHLNRLTRTTDIRCRYGGDEFAVIMKRINDEKTVQKKCELICRTFQDKLAEENITASCSGGIALCSANETISDSIIERADKALYRAKRENKGSCCLWKSTKDEA